jgi:hypothetical protein
MNTTQIALTLPSDQVQYILNVLAERPFKEVGKLIPLILEQATPQVTAAVPADS